MAAALPAQRLANLASRYGEEVLAVAEPLLKLADVDAADQARRLAHLLNSLPAGDIRRGQRVFHDQKTACFTCHAIGYRGGTIGPDLSRIASIRSPRDLLEAILYPSLSFVRSYEPVRVLLKDGREYSGTIRKQSVDEIVLQLSATEQRTLSTMEIESTHPGQVSIMPAGLNKTLSEQELADLLAFLKSRK